MNDLEQTVALLRVLAVEEGYTLTALPGVRLLRSNRSLKRTPVLYDPGIVIVCQGSKRGYFSGEVYHYDAGHYLAVAVPIPFSMETDASEGEPLLAIYLHLDFKLAADLALEIAQRGHLTSASAKSMFSTRMNAALGTSVLRLTQALTDPMEAAILGPALLRELYYRVLTGAQGATLRSALALQGHFGKIFKALQTIHSGYRSVLSVEHLAADAGMSTPTFHSHFKRITGTTPMQYVKSIRLHQARLLMVRSDTSAARAAVEVGYESASHFGREFRRQFGLTPAQEVKRMKSSFAIPPRHSDLFVSSH